MKPTEQEIKIAKQIVKDLVNNNVFDAVISDGYDSFYDWWEEHNQVFSNRGIEAFSGETKICFVCEELPGWVIKVGYTEACPPSKLTEISGETYCDIEARNFSDAVNHELEDFFAAIYELEEVCPSEKYDFNGSVTFYIQEEATPDEEKTSDTTYDHTLSEDNDDFDRIESLFEGANNLDELFYFINVHNINDLHSGNFGYTHNGDVKIIDYSRY